MLNKCDKCATFYKRSASGVLPAGNANFARVQQFIHRLDPKGFPVATGSDDKS